MGTMSQSHFSFLFGESLFRISDGLPNIMTHVYRSFPETL